MVIDIFFIILLVFGFFLGIKKGLIYSVFGFFSIFISVLLALKFGYVAADYLNVQFNWNPSYLSLIGFIVVLILSAICIHLLSKLLEGMANILFMGWLNRLMGGVLWCLIFVFLFSAVLWMLNHTSVLPVEWKFNSKVYVPVMDIAPGVIEQVGSLTPVVKNLFNDIEKMLDEFAQIAS